MIQPCVPRKLRPSAVADKTRECLPPKQKLGGAAGKILLSALLKPKPDAAGWQRRRVRRRRPSSRLQTVHLGVRVRCVIGPHSKTPRNRYQTSVATRPFRRPFPTQACVSYGSVRRACNLCRRTTFPVFPQLVTRNIPGSQHTSHNSMRL
ncbi:hypothetical protein MTO96_031072 [Rhipicephalus appendiculatus]